MSYKLKKLHTSYNYEKGNEGRKYIVIHYTGNKTDTAKANACYFYIGNRGASAHYFVDDTTVYEVVSPKNTAWSVGVNYGTNNLFGKCTNYNSVSIEMCSTNGKISNDTYTNTVTLTKKLMKKYNISASNVVRHYDVCSKICPGWNGWCGSDESIWKQFKSNLTDTKVKLKSNAGLYKTAYADPIGKTSVPTKTIKKGKTVQVLSDDGTGWVKIKVGNVTGWIAASHLGNSCEHSTYKTITVAKCTRVRRLNKAETKFETDTRIGASHKFRLICTITSGKYKGCKYCKLISSDKNNGRMYYVF